MITDSIEYGEAASAKELLGSPVDSPPGDGGDAGCGLSASTSESSSQPSSWNSRHDSPTSKGTSGLSSFMPIVDEDDCPARDSQDGQTSSEEEQLASPSSAVAAFHKAAYERQVRQWQQVEAFYMKHEGWCEHRVILLLQEAGRCSYLNLKRARDEGLLSADVFQARAAELRGSLLAIKKEYRRTLDRTRERRGDLAGIASKAVTCVASVYPWSSEGFVLGFEENLKYGELVGCIAGSARRGAPLFPPAVCSHTTAVVAVPSLKVAAVSMAPLEAEGAEKDGDEGEDSGIAESVVAGGRARRAATPRVSLRPLPPRRQLFQSGAAAGGVSPVVSPSSPAATCVTSSSPAHADPPVRVSAASPPPAGRRSPIPLPPASIAGPLRTGETRFLEKRQLVVQGQAFVSRSLASTSFIASRRAAIAAATMRQRLGLATSKAPAEEAEEEDEEKGETPLTTASVSRRLRGAVESVPAVAAAAAPSTRYPADVSPTPCESAVLDSNANSIARRSNPGSVTNRTVLSNPTAYTVPNAATTRSQPGSMTKRAMGGLDHASGNASGTSNKYCNPLACGVAVHSQPHSYSARAAVGQTVAQSYPHSYTARSVNPAMRSSSNSNNKNSCAVTAPPYPVAPCPSFNAAPQERGGVPVGLPVYRQPGASVPSGYPVVYAVQPAPLAPVPPPCYPSHIRRDRLCAQPASFNSPYAAVPEVSVADEQYVKELW